MDEWIHRRKKERGREEGRGGRRGRRQTIYPNEVERKFKHESDVFGYNELMHHSLSRFDTSSIKKRTRTTIYWIVASIGTPLAYSTIEQDHPHLIYFGCCPLTIQQQSLTNFVWNCNDCSRDFICKIFFFDFVNWIRKVPQSVRFTQ